jgi:hypothetical protein
VKLECHSICCPRIFSKIQGFQNQEKKLLLKLFRLLLQRYIAENLQYVVTLNCVFFLKYGTLNNFREACQKVDPTKAVHFIADRLSRIFITFREGTKSTDMY